MQNPGAALVLTVPEAARAMADLRGKPVALARPVLVLDGWHSPGVTAWGLARRLCTMTSGRWADFAWATYPWALSLEMACGQARRVIARGGLASREVDVVGISMGGLVARALAAGWPNAQPLRVRRMFTIASPHRGARLARRVRLDRASGQMRPGSAFLGELDRAWAARRYDLHAYAIGRDWLVGEENTAPVGMEAPVVPPEGMVARTLAHFASIYDRRIQLDIALRLRAG